MAAPVSFWGSGFFESLNYALKECIHLEKNSRNGVVKDRVMTSQQSAMTHVDRQPTEQLRQPKTEQHDTQNGKRKVKHHPTAPQTNGSQFQVAPPVIAQPPNLDHSPSISPEEPQLFNLKIEPELFLCLKAKLSSDNYLKFIKVLAMFTQSIISFHEFVLLSESILLTLDKEICIALREMIESRYSQVCKVSPFNVRLAKISSNDPTHNRKYCQPQRPGDTVWNTANSRYRRIFNDRTGLASARNTRPFLLQTYRRDMGGGRFVVLKEATAPIVVQGRHWGGLRLAFNF